MASLYVQASGVAGLRILKQPLMHNFYVKHCVLQLPHQKCPGHKMLRCHPAVIEFVVQNDSTCICMQSYASLGSSLSMP